MYEKGDWNNVITSRRKWFSFPVTEVWAYRDLLLLLVRRDFVAMYKQTILGPTWFVIQPLLMTLVFTIIFGNVAKLSTDGLPHILFYMSGIVCWNYFSECLTKTSDTFVQNSSLFGKVYFPRVIVPISIVISGLIKAGVQMALFICILVYFLSTGNKVDPNQIILLFPVLFILLAGLSLALGMAISSMTTKYRDLRFLITFAVQLGMYVTPVIYPLSVIPEKYAIYLYLNPITPIIETFRFGFLGSGSIDLWHLLYSFLFMIMSFVLAMAIFNQVEKDFMDTV
jgi:lipopolysaccharide transport system permease protein